MNTHKKTPWFNVGVLCLALSVGACSDAPKEDRVHDHVWKEQVQTLDRARGAEQKVMEGAKAKDEQIENQTAN